MSVGVQGHADRSLTTALGGGWQALAERPYYLYRPDQLVRRLRHDARPASGSEATAVTPWGMPLRVNPHELVGRALLRTGVIEMPVTEVMWRLIAPDDLALDVGANVGFFTALQAHRAAGVIAFEPHPAIGSRLASSIDAWRTGGWRREAERVTLVPKAASDRSGTAVLTQPPDHAFNEARASLGTDAGGDAVEVETVTLDELVGDREIGMLKLDVEGHELNVLRGAARLLEGQRVRDILFEEHAPLPTPVSRLLAEQGFAIFGLSQRARGVALVPPQSAVAHWHAPTYLATRDAERALSLTAGPGWRSLRPSRHRYSP